MSEPKRSGLMTADKRDDDSETSLRPLSAARWSACRTASAFPFRRTGREVQPAEQKRQPRAQPRMISTIPWSWTILMFGMGKHTAR